MRASFATVVMRISAPTLNRRPGLPAYDTVRANDAITTDQPLIDATDRWSHARDTVTPKVPMPAVIVVAVDARAVAANAPMEAAACFPGDRKTVAAKPPIAAVTALPVAACAVAINEPMDAPVCVPTTSVVAPDHDPIDAVSVLAMGPVEALRNSSSRLIA